MTYSIAIHGGAGGDPSQWSEEVRQLRRAGLTAALRKGVDLLKDGQPALDVVEQVIRIMEDNPVFNAGRGCVLNENGEHELDASIMDGATLRCGAVAGSTLARHPITLARHVMTDTRHVLLIGTGVDNFCKLVDVEQADAGWFRTEHRLDRWRKWKEEHKDASIDLRRPNLPSQAIVQNAHQKAVDSGEDELYLGTVGCVVLDSHGNLAAGTSTGGLMGKRWGRVGDSPILGAGNYADNRSCAVSATGTGEEFIRRAIAADISARMRYGQQDLLSAATQSVAQLPDRSGGVIAVDHLGNIAMPFNTPGMSRGQANSAGVFQIRLGKEQP